MKNKKKSIKTIECLRIRGPAKKHTRFALWNVSCQRNFRYLMHIVPYFSKNRCSISEKCLFLSKRGNKGSNLEFDSISRKLQPGTTIFSVVIDKKKCPRDEPGFCFESRVDSRAGGLFNDLSRPLVLRLFLRELEHGAVGMFAAGDLHSCVQFRHQ